MDTTAKNFARWLWLLLALFCFRVAAQLAALAEPDFLPHFEAWHSSVVPYWLLLTAQVLIIIIFAWTAWRFTRGEVRAQPGLGWLLVGLGSVYFVVMVVRLVLGLTVYASHPWFGRLLPTVFHLVLASFLLVVGCFHVRVGRGG